MVSEFVVEVGAGPSPGVFQTRVVSSAAGGEPTGMMRLGVDDMLTARDRLAAVVLGSAVTARTIVPVGEAEVRRMGEYLFGALFIGEVGSTYRASVVAAQERGEQLRVQLRLTAPKLSALPWEAMFDPGTGTYLSRRERLVRHVPAPYTVPPLPVTGPLRILVIIASPRDLPGLDVDAEVARLASALEVPVREGRIELSWVRHATWPEVQSRLMRGPWHVVHFIGHGDYSLERDQGQIVFEGPDGRRDLVEAERLADLLVEASPTPRLVVLNSCSSGREGLADLFSGTASNLAHNGVSAVAAMQFAVSDPAAIEFARGFYNAIASGRGVDDAVQSGRRAILGLGNTLEWVTPVLYLRGNNAQLFTIRPGRPAVPRPPAPAHPPAAPPGRAPTPVLDDRTTVSPRAVPLLGPAPQPALAAPAIPYGILLPAAPAPVQHKLSWVVLALAIAGFPTYGLTWPVAWILGSMARREIRQHPELYVGGNALNTGWVMGIVGTAIGTVVLLAMMASGVR